MNVLLTGGLGYIGSHTAVELIRAGYSVTIIDNLSNSHISVLAQIESIVGKQVDFVEMDICDVLQYAMLKGKEYQAVIHFAAKKSIPESLANPILYYRNNINGLINLLSYAESRSINQFIFSSSCTVYGLPKSIPVLENESTKIGDTPYGNSKKWGEEILTEYTRLKDDFRCIQLRYFNPVGSDSTAKIGELPLGVPSNLMPFITQTAAGLRNELKIFGSDYNTPDGTAIRDFIHVTDLAKAHIAALKHLGNDSVKFDQFNIGTGRGISVLEVVQAFIELNKIDVPYQFAGRREGDLEQIWADPSKANKTLGWKAELGLEEMVRSAWAWQKNLTKKA